MASCLDCFLLLGDERSHRSLWLEEGPGMSSLLSLAVQATDINTASGGCTGYAH